MKSTVFVLFYFMANIQFPNIYKKNHRDNSPKILNLVLPADTLQNNIAKNAPLKNQAILLLVSSESVYRI